MVKFIAEGKDKRRILGIGLSKENIRRLESGMPIHFHTEELTFNPDFKEVLIVYGETEDTIVQAMRAQTAGPGAIIDKREARKN